MRFRAPAGSLSDDQRARFSAHRNEIIAQLRADAKTELTRFAPSFSQRSLWFLYQQSPASPAYNVAMPLRILSQINLAALQNALQALVDRNPVLRTTYDTIDGALYQCIAGMCVVPFGNHQVTGISEQTLRDLVQADYERPFDLRTGPVFRSSLYCRGPKDHVLLLTIHHIAIDGWSLALLLDELFKLYEHRAKKMPESVARSELQYTDYVTWQENTLAGAEGDRLWNYWRMKMASPRQWPGLPTDYPRPAVQKFSGASISFEISAALTDEIKALSRHEDTTPYVILLAIFEAFLFGLVGSEDIVVGTPVFGRSKVEFMRVIGDFVNSVPLRCRLNELMSFRDVVVQLRQTVSEALDAQEFPLTLLVQRLQPERHAGRSPLFDTFFIYQRFDGFKQIEALLAGNETDHPVEMGSLLLGAYPFHQQEGQFDLTLKLFERENRFFAVFSYCTELFEEITIKRFVDEYLKLVEVLVNMPDQPLGANIKFRKGTLAKDDSILKLLDRLKANDIRVSLDGDRLRLNAPKGTLDRELQSTIAARRDDIIRVLKSGPNPNAEPNSNTIRKIARDGSLPLTAAQKRFWFLEQMQPGRSDYNIGNVVHLRGGLQPKIVQQAISALVERHESLRTSIADRHGTPVVQVNKSAQADVDMAELPEMTEEARERHCRELIQEWLRKPFDIAHGPLARFIIVRLASDHHLLGIAMHHVAADGWSLVILLAEICELYDAIVGNRIPDLRPLPIQYVDYAAFEQNQLNSGQLKEHLTYWKRELEGAPAVLELPADNPRPAKQSFRGHCLYRYLNKQLSESVTEMSRALGATPFAALLAVWQLLLHRYSGQDDIVVGSPFANRDLPGLEGVIGCFVNNAALRSQLNDNPSFASFLGHAKKTALSALEHREVPFDTLVETLNPVRSPRHSPLFQVLFTFMSFPMNVSPPSGLSLEMFDFGVEMSRFDLSVELAMPNFGEHRGELLARYEYATDLFKEQTIARLHAHFEQALVAVTANPHIRVRDLPLSVDDHETRLLDIWNATTVELDRTRCLHSLLEATAAASPQAIAVTVGDQTLSYSDVDRKANQLAHFLIGQGVKAGDRVGICLDRTADMPIALAAVLKAGAAYVPLDPTHPSERLQYTLQDAAVSCVITSNEFALRLGDHANRALSLDDLRDKIANEPEIRPSVVVKPEDLAYVIYTSGSTGRPKGVQVEHGSVVNFLKSMRREPGIAASDVLLAVTTLSFDIAGLEFWLPLSVGARLIIASRSDVLDAERLVELLNEHGVTVLQATPATWQLMLETKWVGSRNLKALCGGEAMRRDLAEALIGKVGELWNMYGPTETTIWSTVFRVSDTTTTIPIGHPIANTRIYILDPSGRRVPVGIWGELCIGGEGVARGYWKRAELTAEKFTTITLPEERIERVYRTGDIARFRWDGQLEFFGRRDQQVKVRGYRIELGEIETALAALPGVKESAVNVHGDSTNDQRLIGYVTLSPGASFDLGEARTALRAELPEYMIPTTFVVLPALPLTPNGKLDRKAFPVPQAPVVTACDEAENFFTPIQSRIAGIWRELLRTERVGLHDNFFDVGGHSLLLVRLHAGLQRQFGSNLALVELFQNTTIAAQAERLSSTTSAGGILERAKARAARQIHG